MGTIQLATQPQLSEIKLIKCEKCKQSYASDSRDYRKMNCKNCSSVINVQQCGKKDCHGELKLVRVSGNMFMKECVKCGES